MAHITVPDGRWLDLRPMTVNDELAVDELGTGAYLTALRRTEVGGFRVEDAAAPDEIADSTPGTLAWAAPLAAIPTLPRRDVSPAERTAIGHGQRIPNLELHGDVALVVGDALVAIGAADGPEIAPRLVLEPA